jgi:hypothetical protein
MFRIAFILPDHPAPTQLTSTISFSIISSIGNWASDEQRTDKSK